jgi:PAS domain-containing protein
MGAAAVMREGAAGAIWRQMLAELRDWEQAPQGPGGIFVTNGQFVITEADRVSAALVDCPPDALIGTTVLGLIPVERRGEVAVLQERIRHEGSALFYFPFRRRDGQSRVGRFLVTRLGAERYVHMLRDVTAGRAPRRTSRLRRRAEVP